MGREEGVRPFTLLNPWLFSQSFAGGGGGGGYQEGWEEERDVIINNASGVPSDQGRGWSWTGQKHLATDKRDISLRVIAVLLKSLSYNSFS